MRIERVEGKIVSVVLSRRNLRALLIKLDTPESACAIYKDYVYLRAEEDADHYIDREPGPMHPDTEAALQ